VTALTALTNEGALYEVDMRLRPSGRAGPLANSLEGFESYHAQSAWTWEHMALTRARVIHGRRAGRAAAPHHPRARCCRPRDPDGLVRDVADMRDRIARMRRPRARGTSSTCRAACSTSTSSPSTWRCATPRSGPTSSTRIPPRCCAAPPTAACSTGRRRRLRAAAALMSDVQSLLRLT
jgi:glutamate-ammonia-ligase adenylyltransferase